MNNHPIELMESVKALEIFSPYGWVFYFLDHDGCFPVMPEEIAVILKTIKDQEETEDMLEEISGYVTREDWTVPQIKNRLYTWDVAFSSDQSAKVYPNDPCPCGSGKKYKKCCGRKQPR